jgi:hypothetical protein
VSHIRRRTIPEAAPSRRPLPTLFLGVFMAALDTAVIAPALRHPVSTPLTAKTAG